MTTKRFYFLMIGLNVIVIAMLLFTVFWGNGLINDQAKKLKVAKTESRIIDQQQISLLQAKKDVEKYRDLNEVVKSIVPQDKDQAKTVREISKLATETGVALKDIRFQTSNLGQTVTPAPAPVQDTPGVTAVPALPTLSQVKPIDGIKGVFALEITISSQESKPTTYTELINFLQRLETNRRTAHVDKISIRPSDNGSTLTFTITLNAYVKP